MPVTTNMMGSFKSLDYFAWAEQVDVISWDSYPELKTRPADIALLHDLMRGLKKGLPFMLMEQAPNQVNWHPYNSVKRPGVMRLWSMQAVAHGADSVMFFQMRASRGGSEKFHSALVSHDGAEDTRVFRDCASLGAELASFGSAILDSRIEASVAVLFDWESWWASELSTRPSRDMAYLDQVRAYYRALHGLNIPVDFARPEWDLSRYGIAVAPMLYMVRPGVAENLRAFVERGGTLVVSCFSGIVDENDLIAPGGWPGMLRDLLGIRVDEMDGLFPGMANTIVMAEGVPGPKGTYACSQQCDLLRLEAAGTSGARALGAFGSDFYAGSAGSGRPSRRPSVLTWETGHSLTLRPGRGSPARSIFHQRERSRSRRSDGSRHHRPHALHLSFRTSSEYHESGLCAGAGKGVDTMKPISIQLYTLREESKTDFPRVVREVGAIGYAGVEPAGLYGLSPAEFRRIVEGEGMVVSSSHGPWASPDNLSEVIETAGALGIDLVSSGFGPEQFADKDAIRRTAETVNGMNEQLRAAGLILFLHNHHWEFETLDGRLKYELFAELAPGVSFEIDTYWAANFGANDPAAMVRKFARRTPLLHIKDGPLKKDKPMTAVGKGKMPIRNLIKAADPAVLRWLVVEIDECATDMLQAVRDSYDFMTREGMAKGRR